MTNGQPFNATYQFTKEVAAAVPAGTYSATFSSIAPCETEYGPKLRLSWTIGNGELTGQQASVLCGVPKGKLTPKHGLHTFACAFTGRTLQEGESINFGQFIGLAGTIVVSPTQGEGTKVTAFLPSQQPQPQPMPMFQKQQPPQQPAVQYQQPSQGPSPQAPSNPQQAVAPAQDSIQQLTERF